MKANENGNNDSKNAAGANWVDYFDALEHEAWLESRKKNFPQYAKQSAVELKLAGNGSPAQKTSPDLN